MGRKKALLAPFLKEGLMKNSYPNILRLDTNGVASLSFPRKSSRLTYEEEKLLKDYEAFRGRKYCRNDYTRVKQAIMQSVKKSLFLNRHPSSGSTICFTFKSNEEIKAMRNDLKNGQNSKAVDLNFENYLASPASDASSGYITGTEDVDITDTIENNSNENILLFANPNQARDPLIQETVEVNDTPEIFEDLQIPEIDDWLGENLENLLPVTNDCLNNFPLEEHDYSTNIPHGGAVLFLDVKEASSDLSSNELSCSIPHETISFNDVLKIDEMENSTYFENLMNISVENELSHNGLDGNTQEVSLKKCWAGTKILEIENGLLQLVCIPKNERILHLQQELKSDFPDITVSDEIAGKICDYVAVDHTIVDGKLLLFLKSRID